MKPVTEDILAVLSGIMHPAKGADIVSLGMVEDVETLEGKVAFRLVFPGRDPLSGSLLRKAEQAVREAFPGVEVLVTELIREKKARAMKMTLGDDTLSQVGKVICIASGKGGVGKSTVAVNLAVALSEMGYRVGLADADVYGPSIPKMTATEGEQPDVTSIDAEDAEDAGDGIDLIEPIDRYGIKWMSIGYFARPEQALIWRGPMASNALKQMVLQVSWGALDFLLIDLPPGTGDIHISLVQEIPLHGAVIVTTPQAVALADVEKGIDMFRNPNVNKPVLGIVENMSWFTPEDLPDRRYYIFGRNGGGRMADKYGVPLLGQVPLIQGIMEGGDQGVPAAISSPDIRSIYLGIARRLVSEL